MADNQQNEVNVPTYREFYVNPSISPEVPEKFLTSLVANISENEGAESKSQFITNGVGDVFKQISFVKLPGDQEKWNRNTTAKWRNLDDEVTKSIFKQLKETPGDTNATQIIDFFRFLNKPDLKKIIQAACVLEHKKEDGNPYFEFEFWYQRQNSINEDQIDIDTFSYFYDRPQEGTLRFLDKNGQVLPGEQNKYTKYIGSKFKLAESLITRRYPKAVKELKAVNELVLDPTKEKDANAVDALILELSSLRLLYLGSFLSDDNVRYAALESKEGNFLAHGVVYKSFDKQQFEQDLFNSNVCVEDVEDKQVLLLDGIPPVSSLSVFMLSAKNSASLFILLATLAVAGVVLSASLNYLFVLGPASSSLSALLGSSLTDPLFTQAIELIGVVSLGVGTFLAQRGEDCLKSPVGALSRLFVPTSSASEPSSKISVDIVKSLP